MKTEPSIDLSNYELVETEQEFELDRAGVPGLDAVTADPHFDESVYFLTFPGQAYQIFSTSSILNLEQVGMTNSPNSGSQSCLHQQPTPLLSQSAGYITLFPPSSSYDPTETSYHQQYQQQQQHVVRTSALPSSSVCDISADQQPSGVKEEQVRKRKLDAEAVCRPDHTDSGPSSAPSSSATPAQTADKAKPYKRRRKGKLLLWQFLLQDLLDGHTCIAWVEDQVRNRGVFKFSDANQAARRWGLYKENENMSYEKMSRCVRDYWIRDGNKYFRVMIADPEKGRRLHFAFNLEHPEVRKFMKNHPAGYYQKLLDQGLVRESDSHSFAPI